MAWLHLTLVLAVVTAGEPRDDDRTIGETKVAPQAPAAESAASAAHVDGDAAKGSAAKKKETTAAKARSGSGGDGASKKKQRSPATEGTLKKQSEPRAAGAKSKPKDAAKTSRDPRLDGAVRVKTLAEMRKPKSEFLLPPGASPNDRYRTDEDDWETLPPWRQTSFFGIRARGQFFVYVVDHSLSMIDDDRFARATIELRRSVFALQQPQRFEVIFYNTESLPMPGGPIPRSADLQAKNQLVLWLRLIEPIGGTDPRVALRQALLLRPDAVFLLSDGDLPDGTVKEVARLNTRKIPIHCVDLAGGLAGDQLKLIAAHSGGEYASRPGDLQGRP